MNTQDLENCLNTTENDSKYIEEIVYDIVDDCCKKLDNYIAYVRSILADDSAVITNEELDEIIMTIPVLTYYAGEAQERIGITKDVADSRYKAMFNDLYVNSEGAAQVRKSIAEDKLKNEILVSIVYSKAYDMISQKVTTALEILKSAKKVVSRRMLASEMERSTFNKDRSVSDVED